MEAIRIERLTKQFGSFVAVSDVSLTVRKGEFMGLLGPNGAGKSTTLKAITGLITPTSGSIEVNGVNCMDHCNAMRSVGCVIETPECYPSCTPTEILTYVGRLHGMDKRELNDRIRGTLEEVRMLEWCDKPIGEFSKGMKQRVALAQALLHDPDILLFDEPTSGLDPRGMIEVREILSDLKRQGKSLLISTHILSEVSEMCDSVTVIRRGKTMMSGNIRDLMRNTSNEVTLKVEVRNPLTDDFMRDMDGFNGISHAERIGDTTFNVVLPWDNDREGIVDLIKSHRLGLMAMNQSGFDIESLYMSLTAEDDRDDIR